MTLSTRVLAQTVKAETAGQTSTKTTAAAVTRTLLGGLLLNVNGLGRGLLVTALRRVATLVGLLRLLGRVLKTKLLEKLFANKTGHVLTRKIIAPVMFGAAIYLRMTFWIVC